MSANYVIHFDLPLFAILANLQISSVCKYEITGKTITKHTIYQHFLKSNYVLFYGFDIQLIIQALLA